MAMIKDKLQHLSWDKADRLAPFILVLLILALCWTLASLFWLFVAPPQAMQFERVALGSQQVQAPNISGFTLFEEQAQTAAQDANLNMQLQGVVVGQPSYSSSAVIKVTDVAERYRVGENIGTTGYQLSEVYWDRVIVRQQNGTTREIKFVGLDTLDQEIVPPSTADQAQNAPLNSVAPFSPSPQNEPENQGTSALDKAIQGMQSDREQYLKNMGVNANTTGGQEGYEISSKTPAALRSRLGLSPGDRILSLNGQSVGQGQSDVQLLEQARQAGQVKLEIKRGDQVMTIQQSF